MKDKTILPACMLAFMLLNSQGVIAHHAFTAQYDAEARTELTGVIVKVEWLNPHAYFYIDVENEETGEVTTWACELGSPVSMMRQGWTRQSLVLGDILVVEGALARDGSASMNAQRVVIESTGQRLFSRQQD
jgi:hypothetical protein